jgi:cob(I)alamin adenosyltransferase
MKIYTKTGDAGTTGLFGGDRVAKTSWRIESIGTVDELNSFLGLAGQSGEPDLAASIVEIQSRLFDVGAELATTPEGKFSIESVRKEDIEALEAMIDQWDEILPPLKNFILPGGTEASARLHVARSVCRRCERSLWRLAAEVEIRQEIMMYLNRLSDWLFAAARLSNHRAGVADQPWHQKTTKL